MPEFIALATGFSFTECPRWRDGRLYFSDMYTHRVLAVSMDGATELIASVPQPSGLGFLPDGRILEELKTEVAVFACMLGGDDGHTLFACVAPSFRESEASAHHHASVLMKKVQVPHAGLP